MPDWLSAMLSVVLLVACRFLAFLSRQAARSERSRDGRKGERRSLLLAPQHLYERYLRVECRVDVSFCGRYRDGSQITVGGRMRSPSREARPLPNMRTQSCVAETVTDADTRDPSMLRQG